MKLAYLLSRYPAVSQTFVLNEVTGLRRDGFDIQTFSIRRAPPEEILSEADRHAAASTFAVLPMPAWRLIRCHVRALVRSPGSYLLTLAYAVSLAGWNLRTLLWQLFYFAESMVVWDQCDRRDIRHIHVHFPNVAADVAMLATRYAGPSWSFSMTLHGPTELFDVPGHKLVEKVSRAKFTICISDHMQSQIMNFVEPERWGSLHLRRCGVDTERFSPRERSLVEGPLNVLAVGRLDHRKGHLLLVQALARLVRAGIDVRCTIVGEGPQRAPLEQAARELNLTSRLNLVGAIGQDRIIDYYRAADVFCLTSFAEGVPTVLMEAMACGVPVVAPGVMGIPELIENGVSGLLVSPGRVDHLVTALTRLLTDPLARAEIGRAARARVEASFEARACVAGVASLFSELAGG